MAVSYQDFIANLANQGVSNVNFIDYASQYGIPVMFNPELNRLLVNGTPVNLANSGLTNQNGQLFGTEQQYLNLITPAYQSQYEPQKQQALDEISGFQPYETPEYMKQFIEQMTQQQQQPFTYDFETDPTVQKAKQELQQQIANMAAKRGFLYGTPQQAIVEQEFAKMAPMFEDVAYKKEQDFLNRQLNLAGVIMQWDQMQADRRIDDLQLWKMKSDFIMKLDQRDFEAFVTMLDQRRTEMEYELDKQRLELQKKKQETEIAYKRLDTLGYADNQTAQILGIKPGTPAQWAKQMVMEQKNNLALMEQKYKYDLKMLEVNKKIEMDLAKTKTKLDLDSKLELMKQEYKYDIKKMEQQHAYDEEVRKVKEEQARAEEAARQAQAEAEAAQKAKVDAEQSVYENKIKNEYSYALKYFKLQLGNGMKGGLVDSAHQQVAASILVELKRMGISDEVINRIEDEYRIPPYDGPIGPPSPVQSAAGVGW